MAFFSKAGNILKQTMTKHFNSEIYKSSPSVFQMIRCMSSKIFIGGISYSTDDMSLKEAFNKYGEVIEARVIIDRETGRSRGFGFVTFTSSEEASAAIQAVDGQELHGRMVKVSYANDRAPRGGGYGYGGGGGYGDGSSGGYGGGGGSGGGGYGGGTFGGGGGYGGGNFGGGGGYGGGDDYGNNGGGGGGGYGGNNYGSGGSRDSYGGGNFAQGGTYASRTGSDSLSSGNYGGGSQGFGVARGVGGSDNYAGGAGGGLNSSFATGGYDGGDQFGIPQSSNMADASGSFAQDNVEGNFRDDDDVPRGYANTRA